MLFGARELFINCLVPGAAEVRTEDSSGLGMCSLGVECLLSMPKTLASVGGSIGCGFISRHISNLASCRNW